MIQIQGLVKCFGHSHALRGMDLEVADGEFLTIVGPNGAGKTTLLRILASLLKPTSGLVRIDGLDLASGGAEMRRRIGFVSHQSLLYSHLTVEENLHFYGRMYDVRLLEKQVQVLLHLVGLEGRRHSPVRTLSRGLQQRLSLARALIHEPPLLLLDEPYAGLDQQATRMLQQLLQTASQQSRTVVVTTHNLEQGLESCNRLAILSKGRIVYQMDKNSLTLTELQEVYRQRTGEEMDAEGAG